jgi:23S rRNA (adenine2503-C2)-methyltransferase
VRFKRNLNVHEIIGQILSIQADLKNDERPGHIVFMGMGEPLLNFENLLKAISILKEPWGFGIGARKITVSTAGYVPGILKWVKAPSVYHQVRLSISLHGTRDSMRNKIMPINHKYSVTDLMNAVKIYYDQTGRRVTFEYLLLKGLNDGKIDARELSRMTKGVAHSVNVIEYNEVKGTGLERSDRGEVFLSELKRLGVAATYRRSKGRDIEAACGQLRGKFVENSAQAE